MTEELNTKEATEEKEAVISKPTEIPKEDQPAEEIKESGETKEEKDDKNPELAGLGGKGDEFFISNEDVTKNKTKIVLDQDHNKGILEEFKEAMKNTPDVTPIMYHKQRDNATEDEEIIKADADDQTSEPISGPYATGVDLPDVKDAVVDENAPVEDGQMKLEVTKDDFEEEEDIRKTEAFLSRIDEYVAHPEKLLFTPEELEDMTRYIGSSIGGADTVKSIADMMEMDVNNILEGMKEEIENPEKAKEVYDKDENGVPYPEDERPLNYANPDDRRKSIEKTLEFRISTEEAIMSAKEITSPEFIAKIFASKYPLYMEKGPAWLIGIMNRYLEGLMINKQNYDLIVSKLNSEGEIRYAIERANKKLFRYIHLNDGKAFTTTHLLIAMVNSAKTIIAKEFDMKVEDVVISDQKQPGLSSLYVVMLFITVRQFTKKIFRDFNRSTFERKLFFQFIGDIQAYENLPEDKRELLMTEWEKFIHNCHFISDDTVALLNKKRQQSRTHRRR